MYIPKHPPPQGDREESAMKLDEAATSFDLAAGSEKHGPAI
ncbi:hypothetical protein [Nocardia miyunensis]|nr:hypothetical protein [Nocardia miyunensis]